MGVERYKEDCTELLVYLVESPEHGPGYRFFDDADIFVAGGVLAIESEMEKQSDRFVRLGVIEAKKDGNRIRFTDEDLAALPVPGEEQWRIGRLSPAYGRSELERQIFHSQVRAAKALLTTLEEEEDSDVTAYVPKKVRGGCLASLAARLGAVGEAFDTIQITTIQYWYGRDWAMKIPTEDLILAEFSLIVSTRIRWGHGVQLVVSDVKPIYACVGNRKRILTSQLTSQTKCGMDGCIYGS